MAYLYIMLALIAFVAKTKGWTQLASILTLVFVSLIGISQLNNLDEPAYGFLVMPLLYLAVNFALSNWKKVESFKWKFLIPIGLSVFFLIPTGMQFNYNEYVVVLNSPSSLFIFIFGAALIPIAQLKVQ